MAARAHVRRPVHVDVREEGVEVPRPERDPQRVGRDEECTPSMVAPLLLERRGVEVLGQRPRRLTKELRETLHLVELGGRDPRHAVAVVVRRRRDGGWRVDWRGCERGRGCRLRGEQRCGLQEELSDEKVSLVII